MTTTPFGYIVTVEGEQAASGAALTPGWFNGDLTRLGAWIAQHWLDRCQIPADAACPVVTVTVTRDGATGTYTV